jgi:Holliday junction resolvase RusA-like endonuclease
VARRYRAWRKLAAGEVMAQRPAKVLGPYRITIVATRPDNRRRDLGNLEKAVSDLLQSMGIVRDDCDAQSIRLTWSDSKPDPKGGVSITLEPA